MENESKRAACDLEVLVARVEGLEKQNRRLRQGLQLGLLVIGAAFLAGAAAPKQEVIEAETVKAVNLEANYLRLRDGRGRVRLLSEWGQFFQFLQENGELHATLNPWDSTLAFWTKEGSLRWKMGESGLELNDAAGRPRMRLDDDRLVFRAEDGSRRVSLDAVHRGELSLHDKSGNRWANLGGGEINLWNREGRSIASLQSVKSGSELWLRSSAGESWASLDRKGLAFKDEEEDLFASLQPDGMVFSDSSGSRIHLTVDDLLGSQLTLFDDQGLAGTQVLSTGLILRDEKGKPLGFLDAKALSFADEDDAGSSGFSARDIGFADAAGTTRAALGRTSEDGTASQDDAALVLFDGSGEVRWRTPER